MREEEEERREYGESLRMFNSIWGQGRKAGQRSDKGFRDRTKRKAIGRRNAGRSRARRLPTRL